MIALPSYKEELMITFKIDASLFLSLMQDRDADPLYALIDRNRSHLDQWLKFPGETLRVHDSLQFIQRMRTRFEQQEGFWLGIWMDDELVGSIGFPNIDYDNKKAEIGYWLGKEHEGRGIITKSVQVLLHYAFEELQLNKVEIGVANENSKSLSIPEKLGFQREGEIRDYEYIQERFHNRIIFGLKSEEWKCQNR